MDWVKFRMFRVFMVLLSASIQPNASMPPLRCHMSCKQLPHEKEWSRKQELITTSSPLLILLAVDSTFQLLGFL